MTIPHTTDQSLSVLRDGKWVAAPNGGRPTPAPAPKPAGTVPVKRTTPPTDTLSGVQRDAFAYLSKLFGSYGLASLAPVIKDYLIQGYSADTIQMLLPDTKEYKERFQANDARVKKGLRALTPAEYIATENSYRSVLRSYGIPAAMWDSSTDYHKFLENDVSAQELEQRVQIARQAVRSDNPAVKATYQAWYAAGLSEGDAIAAVLDPNKALPELERKARAAQLGAAANQQGLTETQAQAERLANLGVSGDNASQGFGQVADIQRHAGTLADRYGMAYGGQKDAEDAVFLNDSAASERIKKLGQAETAAFSGRTLSDSRSLKRGGY